MFPQSVLWIDHRESVAHSVKGTTLPPKHLSWLVSQILPQPQVDLDEQEVRQLPGDDLLSQVPGELDAE